MRLITAPRTGAIAIAALAPMLGLALPAIAAGRPHVAIATSGDHSELIEALPISRRHGSEPRVVMSVPAKRVGGLERGDGIAVSYEVQLTADCDEPSSRCIGDPYHYNPAVETYAVLSDSPGGIAGRKANPISARKRSICRQAKPNREHHCVTVARDDGRKVGSGDCTGRRCWVNLVVSASSPRAHRGEYMAVGGLRPNGAIPQDRGRLNLTRTSPRGVPLHRTATSAKVIENRLPLDQDRGAMLGARLGRLERGEQIEVEARATVDISHLPYNVVLSSQLLVTDRRGDVVRGRGARFVSSRGEISEGNGFNCTQSKGRCTIAKVGAVSVNKAPTTRSGRPMPLYATLVTRAGPKRLEAAPGDRVDIVGGALRAIRYPPAARLDD